jgi:Predicted extracellular endo alpha-1,4 polygalactosaminidase or related polysaccharide hydrolase
MRRALLTLALMLAAPAALALEKPRDWQPPPVEQIPNFREDWRQVVIELASYAKTRKRDFLVLARGGVELVVKGARESQWEDLRDPEGRTFEKRLPEGAVFRPYMRALDGLVLDGLYCGPDAFGKPLAQAIRERIELDRTIADEKARGIQRPPVASPFGPYSIDPQEELRRAAEVRRIAEREERQRRVVYALDAMRQEGRRILSIENCKTRKEADAAYAASDRDRVLTYAAVDLERLSVLPKGHPRAENADPVATITAARNWLPLLRADRFGTKAEWVMALAGTNHDALLIDVAHRGADPLNREEVARLKYKRLGSPRLVLAVLPVGKAYDWRWYWRKGWEAGNPPFLFAPDPDEPGSFVASMAAPQWKELLGQYIAGIIDLGFDGVVLDDLDTYLWFEDLMPLDG